MGPVTLLGSGAIEACLENRIVKIKLSREIKSRILNVVARKEPESTARSSTLTRVGSPVGNSYVGRGNRMFRVPIHVALRIYDNVQQSLNDAAAYDDLDEMLERNAEAE